MADRPTGRQQRAAVMAQMRDQVVPRLPASIDDEYLRGDMDTADYMAVHIRWLQTLAERSGTSLGTMALDGFSYRARSVLEQAQRRQAGSGPTGQPPAGPPSHK